MEEDKLVRINKFLSESGFCSRREADRLIDQGRVTINGTIPEMGTKVGPNDEVRVNGNLIQEKKEERSNNKEELEKNSILKEFPLKCFLGKNNQ